MGYITVGLTFPAEPEKPAGEAAEAEKPLAERTNAELAALAEERGLEVPPNAVKAELLEILGA